TGDDAAGEVGAKRHCVRLVHAHHQALGTELRPAPADLVGLQELVRYVVPVEDRLCCLHRCGRLRRECEPPGSQRKLDAPVRLALEPATLSVAREACVHLPLTVCVAQAARLVAGRCACAARTVRVDECDVEATLGEVQCSPATECSGSGDHDPYIAPTPRRRCGACGTHSLPEHHGAGCRSGDRQECASLHRHCRTSCWAAAETDVCESQSGRYGGSPASTMSPGDLS